MKLQIAHLLMDVIRLLMDLYNWLENKRAVKQVPLSYEVFSVHCFDCDEPTGAFVSDTGALLPPIFCAGCVSHDEEEEEESTEEDAGNQEVPEGD